MEGKNLVKEKLEKLLRDGRVQRTVCSSDGKPVSTYVTAMVDMDVVPILAEYLLDFGVTIERWMPVAEELPEQEGFYRVYQKSGLISDRYFYKGCHEQFVGTQDPVTHWKPIENPPKEV